MESLSIRRPDPPEEAQRAAILAALVAYSDPRAGPGEWPEHDLCLLLHDAAGEAVGGLWGKAFYDWLFVELLFVPQSLRGHGLGAALLATAEEQARGWGCHSLWLDTFSFQARGFYERLGYAVFGEVPDYPAPHSRFLLSKPLPEVACARGHAGIRQIVAPGPADRAAILEPLVVFNNARIGATAPQSSRDLARLVENAQGEVLGGLWGEVYYGWAWIELLVVPEAGRGRGLGSRLLAMAEEEARALGCIGLWLDTFSFQARGFYERHGYRLVGTLRDYPAPHQRFFLTKRFDAA
jgi:GNAT superfamily N-acetyltransferase